MAVIKRPNRSAGLIVFLCMICISSTYAGVIAETQRSPSRSELDVKEGAVPNQTPSQVDLDEIKRGGCVTDDVIYNDGDTIPGAGPCEKCICDAPKIVCSMETCPPNPGCKMFERTGECCPVYQCECDLYDRVYDNGAKVEEVGCRACYCIGGQIICTNVECYEREDCEGIVKEGVCCKNYDHCLPVDINLNVSKTIVDGVNSITEAARIDTQAPEKIELVTTTVIPPLPSEATAVTFDSTTTDKPAEKTEKCGTEPPSSDSLIYAAYVQHSPATIQSILSDVKKMKEKMSAEDLNATDDLVVRVMMKESIPSTPYFQSAETTPYTDEDLAYALSVYREVCSESNDMNLNDKEDSVSTVPTTTELELSMRLLSKPKPIKLSGDDAKVNLDNYDCTRLPAMEHDFRNRLDLYNEYERGAEETLRKNINSTTIEISATTLSITLADNAITQLFVDPELEETTYEAKVIDHTPHDGRIEKLDTDSTNPLPSDSPPVSEHTDSKINDLSSPPELNVVQLMINGKQHTDDASNIAEQHDKLRINQPEVDDHKPDEIKVALVYDIEDASSNVPFETSLNKMVTTEPVGQTPKKLANESVDQIPKKIATETVSQTSNNKLESSTTTATTVPYDKINEITTPANLVSPGDRNMEVMANPTFVGKISGVPTKFFYTVNSVYVANKVSDTEHSGETPVDESVTLNSENGAGNTDENMRQVDDKVSPDNYKILLDTLKITPVPVLSNATMVPLSWLKRQLNESALNVHQHASPLNDGAVGPPTPFPNFSASSPQHQWNKSNIEKQSYIDAPSIIVLCPESTDSSIMTDTKSTNPAKQSNEPAMKDEMLKTVSKTDGAIDVNRTANMVEMSRTLVPLVEPIASKLNNIMNEANSATNFTTLAPLLIQKDDSDLKYEPTIQDSTTSTAESTIIGSTFKSENINPIMSAGKESRNTDKMEERVYDPLMPYPDEYPEEYQTIQNGPAIIITRTTYTRVPDVTYTTVTMATLPTYQQVEEAADGFAGTMFDQDNSKKKADKAEENAKHFDISVKKIETSDEPSFRKVRTETKFDETAAIGDTDTEPGDKDEAHISPHSGDKMEKVANVRSNDAVAGGLPSLDENDEKLVQNFLEKNLRLG